MVDEQHDLLRANPLLAPSGAMLMAHVALDAAIERHATSPLGLDSYMADLLVQLARSSDGRLRGVDVARQLLITSSRTTRLIDRAEIAGLVRRTTEPGDRRVVAIEATEKGLALTRQYAPRLIAVLEKVFFEGLDDSERSALIKLSNKVAEQARRVAAMADFSGTESPHTRR